MNTLNPVPEESTEQSGSPLSVADSGTALQRRLVRSVVAAVVWALLGLWLRSNPRLIAGDMFICLTAYAAFGALTIWGPVSLLKVVARYLRIS